MKSQDAGVDLCRGAGEVTRALHRPFDAARVDAGRELFNDFGERDFSSGLWE